MNLLLVPPLILVGYGFFIVLRSLRDVWSIPIPRLLTYKPTRQSSEIFATRHAQQEKVLLGLGFTKALTSYIQFEPAHLPYPDYIRFYLDSTQTILIQVSDPLTPAEATALKLSIWSCLGDQSILITCPDNRSRFSLLWNEILAAPWRILNLSQSTDLAMLLQEHRQALTRLCRDKGSPLPWESGETLARTMENVVNRYVAEQYREGKLMAAPDGSLRLGGGVSVLSQLLEIVLVRNILRGYKKRRNDEIGDCSLEVGPYFFRLWQQQLNFQPNLMIQLMIVGASTLFFLVMLLVLMGPIFAVMGLTVLLFYEVSRSVFLWITGAQQFRLTLRPLLAGRVDRFSERLSSKQEFFFGLSGPLPVILLGWALLYLLPQNDGNFSSLFNNLGLFLLLVGYFNLLPLFPLDGGKVLRALFPPRAAIFWVSYELLFAFMVLLLARFLESPILACLGGIHFLGGLWHLGTVRKLKEWGAALNERLAKQENSENLIKQAFLLYYQYFPQCSRHGLTNNIKEIYRALLYWRKINLNGWLMLLGIVVYSSIFILPFWMLNHSEPNWRFLVQQNIWEPEELALQEKALRGLDYRELLVTLLRNRDGFRCRTSQVVATMMQQSSEISGSEAKLKSPVLEEEVIAVENSLNLRLPKDYRSFVMVSNGLPSPLDETAYFLLPIQQVFPLAEANPAFSHGGRFLKPVPLAGRAANDNSAQSVGLGQLNKMLLIGYLPGSADPILLDAEGSRSGAPWRVYVLVTNENGRILLPYPSLRYFLEEEQMSSWTCIEAERRIIQRNQSRNSDPLVRAFFEVKDVLTKQKEKI